LFQLRLLLLINISPAIIHFCNKLFEEGKKCHFLLAHNFNWELGCLAVAQNIKQLFLVVYMPIGNKAFDKIFMKVRTKTGAELLPATDMRNAIIPYRNKLYGLALVADQNPGYPKSAYWLNFFGKPTPFVKGPRVEQEEETLLLFFARS
jgi:KDO2-lipid IV(A) lauroyltransferase